ncbi:MAG: hypothetical protein LBL17_02190 [Coxiellaceae bacterium]|jgi:uridylate kinase|nr:hypothetical protein [Coxiellaceae bacterium]
MTTPKKYRYKRIILKFSGEALIGQEVYGIGCQIIEEIAYDIKALLKAKIQIGIVVGGGNFFRGAKLKRCKLSHITGDHLGMISTTLNALAMRDIFTQLKIPTKVMYAC